MKKKKAIIINLLVIIVVLTVFMAVEGAGLTAAAAHKKQERTVNYGPSQTVSVIPKDGKRFFLAKFKDYYSCDAVKRGFLGLWYGSRAGNVWGMENDREKVVNYHITGERDAQKNDVDLLAVYGIINWGKENIVSLEIEVLIQNIEGELTTEKIRVSRRDQAGIKGGAKAGTETGPVTEVAGVTIATDGGIYDDMFLAFIEQEGMEYFYVKKILAFNSNGQLVFEETDEQAAYIEQNNIVY